MFTIHIFIIVILINTVWFLTVFYFGEQHEILTHHVYGVFGIQVYVGNLIRTMQYTRTQV
jgi:hypothetical protein